MNTFWGSGGIAPRFTNLDIRWGWVVSFPHRLLYPLNRHRYPLGIRLSGTQSRSGRGGEKNSIIAPVGDKHRSLSP